MDNIKFFAIVFLVISIIFFGITLYLLVDMVKKHKNYDECTGIITDFNGYQPEKPGHYYIHQISPIVSYTVGGINYNFQGDFFSRNMRVGTKVQVYYHKEDYSKAFMKSGVHIAPLLTGGISIIFMLSSVLFYYIGVLVY